MTKMFDSHAHYNSHKFQEENVDAFALIESLFEQSVEGIVMAGCSIADSLECISFAEKFEKMYAIVGIHPHDSAKAGDKDKIIADLEKMISNKKVVAIGEIGLDYHYDFSDRESQKEIFDLQLEFAHKRNIPVVIHDREAHGDIFDMIRKYDGIRGIMHSYSGSWESAREYIKRGWYISFSGSVTFKNATHLLDTVKNAPIDRILIETDCPYLTPVPHRGKLNHSGYMIHTAEKIAEIRGITLDEVIEATTANAKRAFGII